MTEPIATCFISYNHADKPLAESLQTGLTGLGYRVWIDQGELRIGDSLVDAISSAIDQVDFLIALVSTTSVQSNWCQKEVSLAMSGEIARNGITVLPCRVGDVSMPATLADKLYLALDADNTSDAVSTLDNDMRRHLAPIAPLPPRRRPAASTAGKVGAQPTGYDPHIPVKVLWVDSDHVGKPRNDMTRGSGLYTVPFMLSARPDSLWVRIFVANWNHPPEHSSGHRPGIASVSGDRVLLNGTTMDEVEQCHAKTLRLVVEATNRERAAAAERDDRQRESTARQEDVHRQSIAEIARRLKFE